MSISFPTSPVDLQVYGYQNRQWQFRAGAGWARFINWGQTNMSFVPLGADLVSGYVEASVTQLPMPLSTAWQQVNYI